MAKVQLMVVSNSSPLIYLAKVGRLNLIKDVYGRIWIPEAVFYEVVTQGKALGIAEASIVEGAVDQWIFKGGVRSEIDSKYGFLDENERIGPGERQALKLCKQLNADLFIVDDKEARRVAKIMKVKTLGTCGILIQARRQSLVSSEEAEGILNDLVKAGFRIDLSLYRRVTEELIDHERL